MTDPSRGPCYRRGPRAFKRAESWLRGWRHRPVGSPRALGLGEPRPLQYRGEPSWWRHCDDHAADAASPASIRGPCHGWHGGDAMTMITAVTADGARIALDNKDVEGLRSALRGELIGSGHGGYETMRRVWNGNVDRRPALIARCT